MLGTKVIDLLVLEKIFKDFLPYIGVAAILIMWPEQYLQMSQGLDIYKYTHSALR